MRPIDATVAETDSLLWIQDKKLALNINTSTVSHYKLYSFDFQPWLRHYRYTEVLSCKAVQICSAVCLLHKEINNEQIGKQLERSSGLILKYETQYRGNRSDIHNGILAGMPNSQNWEHCLLWPVVLVLEEMYLK